MNKITLPSGKSVLTAEPYEPAASLLSPLIGRHRELRMITAAWISGEAAPPLCPLLIGEPGLGKNRLVYELARRAGLPLYILQGHEDITAEDLACAVRFADDGGRGMEYVLSPLVTAMHRGGICFIDEIGKIRPRALALLVSVLDERRYIDSTLLGERVYAHPAFRFVAATNTGEVNALADFIRSRMRPAIEVGFPPKEEINEIIARHVAVADNLTELLESFWSLWITAKRRPTPRDAIHLFALATSLGDCERAGFVSSAIEPQTSPSIRLLERPPGAFPLTPSLLREAFEQLFVAAA